jgi:RNase adaptor protein for sRNA GlmZ degradation
VIGCSGGRHRSAAVAARVGRQLELDGIAVTVDHLDIGKPVVSRGTEAS